MIELQKNNLYAYKRIQQSVDSNHWLNRTSARKFKPAYDRICKKDYVECVFAEKTSATSLIVIYTFGSILCTISFILTT